MTDPTVTPAEPLDQPEPPEKAAKRAAFVADLRAFANLLADNPWAPVPRWADATEHLNDSGQPETVVPSLAMLRDIAARLGVEVDEHLADRTSAVAALGRISYKVIAWHLGGRPGKPDPREAELEQLRAEVAELRAAVPAGDLDGDNGLSYSREADDPTPVSPGRVPPHTGGVVDGGQLVDETASAE